MWLIVSSQSIHKLHLLFCCVLSILALIWLVLMALFELLLKDIQFLSYVFTFLANFTFSRVIFRLFVAWSVHWFVFLCIFVFGLYLFSWGLCCLNFFHGWNQSFSAHVSVVFELSYRCIDIIFNTGASSSSFFSWHYDVKPYASSWVISSSTSRMVRVPYKGNSPDIHPFDKVSVT